MPPKKGQKFNHYDEATKKEAVRLRLDEQWSYAMIMKKLGIKSKFQIHSWVTKHQNGESFEDYRGRWSKKHFSSLEEENKYLKAQVEYLKKLNPNLHGEGSWISKPGSGPSKK
jgi:transposase